MTEHHPEHDPYFPHDVVLGETVILGEPTMIRARLHVDEAPARGREELLPRVRLTGTRRYLHLKPYILESAFSLTVDTGIRTADAGATGAVVDSAWDGMRHLEIGEAQAWGYPDQRTAVFWECFLLDRFRQDDPLDDQVLTALWQGVERLVLEHLPAVERIVTPSWEDLYSPRRWQAFLESQGYAPLHRRAFARPVALPATS